MGRPEYQLTKDVFRLLRLPNVVPPLIRTSNNQLKLPNPHNQSSKRAVTFF